MILSNVVLHTSGRGEWLRRRPAPFWLTRHERKVMANLTRRNFIGVGVAGALGAAGLGLAGCAPQKEAEESLSSTGPDNLVWDEEYDVVVAGFGGAGGAAAIEAFDNGASVLVLDSDAMPGGATSINGGVIQCAGSSVQKAAGIEDNVDDWFDFIKAMEGPSFHEELIRPMTLETPENVDWLIGLARRFPQKFTPLRRAIFPKAACTSTMAPWTSTPTGRLHLAATYW